MSSDGSSISNCKYCLDELENSFEKFHEAHTECTKQFNECLAKFEPLTDRILEVLPNHIIKLFLEPKINLKNLGSFSHSQFQHLQNKLIKIASEFSSTDQFIIILFHSSEIGFIVCNQIDSLPNFLFDLKSLLYLGVTFTTNFSGLDEFSLAFFPNLLCLDLTLQTNHPFPRILNGGNQKSLKYLKLTQPPTNPNIQVPDGIESCLDLEILTLDIPLTEYPLSLCYLSKLHSLRITGSIKNWKVIFPNSMVNLTSLQSLELISKIIPYKTDEDDEQELLENINSIEVINVTVEDRLLNLHTLLVQGFTFGYDEFFPILNARRLDKLAIIYCDLDEISEEFVIFESLKELNLSNNRIEEIPDFIRRLGYVQNIHIEHNRVKDLTNLCRINRIQFIDASHNIIEVVPEHLISKKKIQVNLNDNKISLNQTSSSI